MNKRQAKIEALRIAFDLCYRCDMCMWDADDEAVSEKDQHKIIKALHELGWQLDERADRMDNPQRRE